MRKEVVILVLGLVSCHEVFEEIVRSLRSVQSYRVWATSVTEREFLVEWTSVLQDFDGVLLVGVDGSEEILRRLGNYKGPVVAATPVKIASFYKVLRETGEWLEGQKDPLRVVVEIGIPGFVDEVKKTFECYFEGKVDRLRGK